MSRIEVSAHHDGLVAAQLLGVGEKGVVVAELVGKTLLVPGAVGKVDVAEVEGRIFDVKKASLPPKARIGQLAVHAQRFEFGFRREKTATPE